MSKFFSLYNTFEDFYATFYRGNEVEFVYNEERYFVLPMFDDSQNICGVVFGQENTDYETICKSTQDLYNATISETFLGNILDEIEVVWHNT